MLDMPGNFCKKHAHISILGSTHATQKKSEHAHPLYSLTSINDTIGHKNFSFCEQTLHKGLIDASCNWLQSTRKNRGQNIFLRKLRAKIQFPGLLFSLLRYISSYNPHTILKKYATRSTKKYIYFYSQELQVGPVDAACRERQYATKNRARTNFLRKI